MSTIETDPQVVITRVFDAPRELVFRAWTDPQHLANWYAPNGCTIEVQSLDLRVGGKFLHSVRNPNVDCNCYALYQEIVPPERLVYTLGFADEHGDSAPVPKYHQDFEWPAETTVTVTFADEGGKTKVTLHQTVSEALAKKTGAYPSWLQMFDRLAEDLAGS